MRLWRRLLTGAAVAAMAAVSAPAAMASTTPSLSLDQSAGHTAGKNANLGVNLNFANSGSDSPHNLTLNLPPGLLASATINGGACLKTVDLTDSKCQVGSGTVTAQPDALVPLPAPVSVAVTFHLVRPPAAGDLAGLAVYSSTLGEQLGSTGDIKVRPTGNPDGVGLTIKLALPDHLTLTLPILGTVNAAQVSIESIASTFDGMRYPATCPSSPAPLTASVDSYSDATVHTVGAPLSVTGCSSMPYNPAFSASVRQDAGDRQVSLTSRITQAADEAPNRSVSLAFPTATLSPNLAAIGALCRNLSSSCQTVGSATAKSAVYPTALSGKAYLTGNSQGLALTLVFPAPFSLTLTGRVDIAHNTATFNGLPDIPLTSLGVTLNGGPKGLFRSNCRTPSGTAMARLTAQNGDQHRAVASKFTVANCHVKGISVHGTGGGSGGSGGGSGPTSPTSPPKVTTKTVKGLSTGKPSLMFRVVEGRKAPKLNRLTVALPKGLSFTRHRVKVKAKAKHKTRTVLKVTGVSLKGAKIKSLSLSHGHLVITLRRPVRALTVKLGSSALRESKTMRAKAASHKLKTLKLKVTVRNVKHRNRTLTIRVKPQHL